MAQSQLRAWLGPKCAVFLVNLRTPVCSPVGTPPLRLPHRGAALTTGGDAEPAGERSRAEPGVLKDSCLVARRTGGFVCENRMRVLS